MYVRGLCASLAVFVLVLLPASADAVVVATAGSTVSITQAVEGSTANIRGVVGSPVSACRPSRLVLLFHAGVVIGRALSGTDGKWVMSLPISAGTPIVAGLPKKNVGPTSSQTSCSWALSQPVTVARASSHSLFLVRSGDGGGLVTCNGEPCRSTYADGTNVLVSATADPGSVFEGWSASCGGRRPQCGVPMTKDRIVRYGFARVPVDGTYVIVHSDPGEDIGQGFDYVHTLNNSVIKPFIDGRRLAIEVDGYDGWGMEFVVPDRLSAPAVGAYPGVTRWPFDDPSVGGMAVVGDSVGCNTLIGSFTITTLVVDPDGSVRHLDMSFEQHCDASIPALRGVIHYDRADVGIFDDPGPAPTWQPPADAVPNTGTYLYLEGDPGDQLVGPTRYTYTSTNARIYASTYRGELGVTVVGAKTWVAQFLQPARYTTFRAGYLPYVDLYGVHNPVYGAIDVYQIGLSCYRAIGWVSVDDIGFNAQGALDHVTLRFEQHCQGDGPATRGKLRFVAGAT